MQVLVTFLPCNKRVEDQAFGRTSRQGNSGTAKLIIKESELNRLGIDPDNNFETIKIIRDLREMERIRQIKEIRILELNFQDELFQLFSNLYQKLRRNDNSEGEYKCALNDLKEYWAFWLEGKNYRGSVVSTKDIRDEFQDFQAKAHHTISGCITFNPYYSIQQAEHFILNEKLDKAETALKHAIKISRNPEILHSAYIKLFEISIERGNVLMEKFIDTVKGIISIQMIKPDRTYKEKAKSYLSSAKNAFKLELDYIDKLFADDEFTNIIKEVDKRDKSYLYSAKDIEQAGLVILLQFNVDFKILTREQINQFCKELNLKENSPLLICLNIDSSKYWANICIIKIHNRIKILFKEICCTGSNIEIIMNEFKYHLNNVDLIKHNESAQLIDKSACGPMTLENLRIMAKSIRNYGVEHFIMNFNELKFAQESDVSDLKDDFFDYLPQEINMDNNFFVKHISSKKLALGVNMEQVNGLIQQIDTHGGGLAFQTRVSDYFLNLKPKTIGEKQLKENILNSELKELASIGTNIVYSLKEIHDLNQKLVALALIQIGGGIALITSGLLFPAALPVTSSIGGTMISEGLCDIAIELILQRDQGQWNSEIQIAYIKGKVISYGIALVTLGITTALQCPKILKAAKNACQWISGTLRKSPYFTKACEYIATTFDKLAKWFEKLETVAKYNKMTNLSKYEFMSNAKEAMEYEKLKYLGENLKHFNSLKSEYEMFGRITELTKLQNFAMTLKQVALTVSVNVTKQVATNVVMTKIITPKLMSLMSGLKPTIREHVDQSIRQNIDKNKLKFYTIDHLKIIINKIQNSIDFESVKTIFRETIISLTKQCNNWKIQLGSLAIDQIKSWVSVYNYVKNLCLKINEEMNTSDKIEHENIDALLTQLIDQLANDMYSQFVTATIKTGTDLYAVGKSAYENYKNEKIELNKCLAYSRIHENGGEAGQEQIHALSDMKKRPVYILCENDKIIKIGAQYNGEPIELSHFAADENNTFGHYVPRGEDKTWSLNDDTNNCLYNAVALQIGDDPRVLRADTIDCIKSDPSFYIASNIHEFMPEEKHHLLMHGGRRFNTVNPGGKKVKEEKLSGKKQGGKQLSQHALKELKKKKALELEEAEDEKEEAKTKDMAGLRGSHICHMSDGARGAVSENAGHAKSHTKPDMSKPTHTYISDKEQHKYICDMIHNTHEFKLAVKKVQEAFQNYLEMKKFDKNLKVPAECRQTVKIPIAHLLRHLSKEQQQVYSKVLIAPNKALVNAKFIITVVDAAELTADRPYHMQTMYPEC